MATRLTNEIRTGLKELVKSKIDFPAHEKREAEGKRAFFKELKRIALAKWPQKDMRVLKKYNFSSDVFCVRPTLVLDGGRHVNPLYLGYGRDNRTPEITKEDYEKGLGVLGCQEGYSSQNLAFDEAGTKAYDAWEKAWCERTAALENGHKDYIALIHGSTTLEQVEKVWPAATAIRTKIRRTLPVVVLDDVINRIRRDQSARAA